jgi:hypothetical protein
MLNRTRTTTIEGPSPEKLVDAKTNIAKQPKSKIQRAKSSLDFEIGQKKKSMKMTFEAV